MNNNYTIGWDTNTNYATVSSGTGFSINNIKNNQNNNMKESNKELYKLTFIKTTTTEYVYEVLAEDLEQAKAMVERGAVSDVRTLSEDIELFSAEDSDGNEVEE